MNPELQRNLWLEATPRRVAWALMVLGLVYLAAAMLTWRGAEGPWPALAGAGGLVFIACGCIWGARAAGGSVLAEVADRTWEFQRLSALSPWDMTWGKLVGAASLAWVCAATGAVLLAVQALRQGQDLWSLAFLASLAVLLQGVSLAAALAGVRKARAEGRQARAGGVLGGLAIGLILLLGAASSEGFQRGIGLSGLSNLFNSQGGMVIWWTWPTASGEFRTLVTASLAAWAVVAAWRLMRLELQLQNMPVAWPLFLVWLAVLVGGFPFLQGGFRASLLTAALAVALCAYAAAFAEPADPIRLRSFAAAAQRGLWRQAALMAPAALAPVILAVLLVLLALAGQAEGGRPNAAQAAGLVAFVIRDLGVVAYFRLGPRPQRGDFAAIVALAVLYFVGGVLGGVVGSGLGRALFAPLGEAPWASLASGLGQALLVWSLAARRITRPDPGVG